MGIEPEIRTTAGVVRGRWEDGVAVFRGIPYAQPPFGARRFAAPVAVRPWDGVCEALEFGPVVPQAGNVPVGEDCLTVNVWSPDLGAAGLPVMVWIHGGAYLDGSASNPDYDGAVLAGAGVVMVSMNYRTGFEGWAHIAGAPDNRGLLDQTAALRWVQDNVVAFGGDPGNVTVFGQSAGAGSVAALLSTSMTAGLFRRAIAQSVPSTYFSTELAAAVSATIAAELGVRANVAELAGISPQALVDATGSIIEKMPDQVESWGPMALTPTPFSPVVGGEVLPSAPWRALAGGTARGIDLLVGHTRDEYRMFNPFRDGEVSDELLTTTHRRLAPGANGAYRNAYPEATSGQLYELINADWLFRMPSLYLADAKHAGGGQVWNYELTWSFNRDEGASHCLDFLLVFGTRTPDELRTHPSAHPDAAEEFARLSHQMRTEWVNFATTGDPGWTRYDSAARLTRVYAADPVTQPYPEERSRRIWQEHQFDTSDLLPVT